MFTSIAHSIQTRVDKILTDKGFGYFDRISMRKKIGQWLILGSAAVVALALFWDCPWPVKIIIQMSYGVLLFFGTALALDQSTKKK